MADTSNNDDFNYWAETLAFLVSKVFTKETWLKNQYKNPVLNPLKATFDTFYQNPDATNFEPFRQALQTCKEAENNKVTDANFTQILEAAQQYSLFHAGQRLQKRPAPGK